MKKIWRFVWISLIAVPLLGVMLLIGLLAWDSYEDYKGYQAESSTRFKTVQKSGSTQTTAEGIFGSDWQTVCLMVGFRYQYRDAEFGWLSQKLGVQVVYEDVPSSFHGDGGIGMVAFVNKGGHLVKESGFNAQEWAMMDKGELVCTKNHKARIALKEGVWIPDFEDKWDVYKDIDVP